MPRHHRTLTHRHRIPAQHARPVPCFFDLPRDLEVAQITALGASMDAAVLCASGQCTCHQHGRSLSHLTAADALLDLTQVLVDLYTSTTVNGKRGTNDLDLFTTTFHQIVTRAYPGFLHFLQRTPSSVAELAAFTREERLTTLCAAAETQLSLLTSCPDGPLPLVWPAPLESEVG